MYTYTLLEWVADGRTVGQYFEHEVDAEQFARQHCLTIYTTSEVTV